MRQRQRQRQRQNNFQSYVYKYIIKNCNIYQFMLNKKVYESLFRNNNPQNYNEAVSYQDISNRYLPRSTMIQRDTLSIALSLKFSSFHAMLDFDFEVFLLMLCYNEI